jgi:plastocyanin
MSDETTTPEPDGPKALPSGAPEEKSLVTFWHRPHVEQFLVPLVLPVAVILFVVVYVMNVSRLFLSGHEHIPVIVGTVITTIILVGAVLLSSAASRLSKSVITLVAAFFVLSITGSGWLLVGTASGGEGEATTLPNTLKTNVTEEITAAPGGALSFAPNAQTSETGLVKFDVLVGAPGHTLAFTDAETKLATPMQLEPPGETVSEIGFFGEAGEYKYICTIPGHEAAGMWGTLTVEGDTMTLEEALVDAGNPATLEGGSGGGGGGGH